MTPPIKFLFGIKKKILYWLKPGPKKLTFVTKEFTHTTTIAVLIK